MDAVILSAGLGTRLRPLTLNTPKPLLEVGDKPIIEHTLAILPPEVDRVVIVVKYLAEQIVARIGTKSHGRPVTYVHQEKLGGTGAALTEAQVALRPGKFIVLMGDDLYDPVDLNELVRYDYAILVKEVDDPKRFGTVELGPDGFVSAIREAGDGNPKPPYLVNCGVYVVDQAYFDLPQKRTPKGEVGLPQTMVQLAGKKITAVRARSWRSIGTPQELAFVRQAFEK